MAELSSKLDNYDIGGISIYFLVTVGAGLLSMCTSKRNTVSGYFLGNKESAWYMIGASVFASNIGTEHFIGLAGSGAAVGISVGAFEISGLVLLQFLAWVFLPVYIASKAYTLPEYIKKRFGGSRIRVYLACMSLTLYIFTKISVALYSGILFVDQSLQWNRWLAILLLLGMTAVSSLTGGLKAAMYTEVLQAVSILIGAGAIFIIALVRIGGYRNLVERYPSAKANISYSVGDVNCSRLPLPDAFVMLREVDDPNLPWVAFLFGQTTVSVWYWAADQMMVQRMLAAKSLSHAKGGALLAGYFKFAFLFVMILPGMIGRVFWPDEVACADPDICEQVCGNRRGCTDIVYPKLVMDLLPSGLRGLMLAVMLSSLVSDLLSIFNSASALFTIDIWSKIRRSADAREILIVGRFFNVALLAISIMWVPLIQDLQGGQLFFYIKAIAAYLAPPVGAVYILAMGWKRCNEQGAFYGLMAGLAVGLVRMTLDFLYRAPECGMPDMRPSITKNVHFMYFAMIVFTVTVVTAVIVSLLTPAPSEEKLIRTTFATRYDETVREDDFKYDRRRSRSVSLVELSEVSFVELDSEDRYDFLDEKTGEQKINTEIKQISVIRKLRLEVDDQSIRETKTSYPPRLLDITTKKFSDCCCGIGESSAEEKKAHDVSWPPGDQARMHPVFARVLQYHDLSVAGELFYLSDNDIIKDLPQVCQRLEEMISESTYLTSSNDQSVVEICITRITTAVGNTGLLSFFCPLLLRLLGTCLSHNLSPNANDEDPPHAKIASDIINCIFLQYSKRDIMEAAMPVGIQFLHANNPKLTRNMSSYLSLIVIQQPFLASLYIMDMLRAILKGNLQLTKVLPQLYTVNSKPVVDNLEALVKVFPACDASEKESLLNLCSLIVKDHPQDLWPVVGNLVDVMADATCTDAILRIFCLIANHSAVPFLTHMTKFKKRIDDNPGALASAARIFGAIGLLGETVAKDCLQYLISRSVMMDPSYVSYVAKEIKSLLVAYPELRPGADSLMAKHSLGGNSNVLFIVESFNAPATSELGDKFARPLYDLPPPYHPGGDFGDHSGSRQIMPRTSPFTSRLYGLGKSSQEVRQLSGISLSRPRPPLYGSASHVPLRLTCDISPKTLGSSHGSVGGDVNAKTSQHSLHSINNSRHSLVSSGFLSTPIKDSRHSVMTGARANCPLLARGSSTELSTKLGHIPALSPIYSRTGEDHGVDGDNRPLPTFTLENPCLSRSSEAIFARSRRNSRHSLAPRPRSRLMETGQPQVIQVVPIHDAVYQFCERNLEKIRKYMASVLVRFPLPARCAIEQHKSRKQCKLFFACQCKGDQCLYAVRFFSFSTKIPKVWIHLMFLAIQAKAGSALNQQDSAVHGLKLCWDHLNSGKDFATLVTSAFPPPAAQEEMLQELSSARYFDVFEYNASIKQWGCFLCNYPEKASTLFSNGTPLMEGILKEKKGRWKVFKRWRPRYFTLSGSYLTYKSSTAKIVPIDMRRIRSLKAVNARGIRSIPTVFEVFTNDDKVFLLKAKDVASAEQWLQCLQIAMARSQSEEYGRIV